MLVPQRVGTVGASGRGALASLVPLLTAAPAPLVPRLTAVLAPLVPRLIAALALLAPLLAAAPARPPAQEPSPVRVEGLRTEHLDEPLGIDVPRPRLSWRLVAPGLRGVVQTAYQIQVVTGDADFEAGDAGFEAGDPLWDSGRTVSSDPTLHAYGGPELVSATRYRWRVRVWDGDDRPSPWSAAATFETGLLAAADWQARWIEPSWREDPSEPLPSPFLRGRFTVDDEVASARAYVTAHGLYELHINGERVGDELFTPGWTAYEERLQVQTHDVTGLVRRGDNAVGAVLGDGWYRGTGPFGAGRALYGDRLGLLVQLRIETADGRVTVVGSDGSWKATTGPILMSDIFLGETYDARAEMPGWSTPGFDDGGWLPVRVADHDLTRLVGPAAPPVRRIEELRPVEVGRSPDGRLLFDLGQNMVGWVRLRVRGEPGTEVVLHHGEVLDADGNLYTENLRDARQVVRYTLSGAGDEVYEPRFTFMGFRYVAVEGLPGEATPDTLTGIVIHTDMRRTGHLETSDARLNQLVHNIVWGQKGNFLDVPTDCPQRDERLGWTGDAQVFARTGAFHFDVAGFFTKWLDDLEAEQRGNGNVPWVVPDHGALPEPGAGSAGWGDAAVIVPWTLYLVYGDERILEERYDSMAAWVRWVEGQAGPDRVWDTGFHFGDWLAPQETPEDLVATAHFAHSAGLLARVAAVLGRDADADRWTALRSEVVAAFQGRFLASDGSLSADTQAAHVLALDFDLLPEADRAAAADRLVELIRARGTHLSTGFLTTHRLLPVLAETGHLEVAWELLSQDTWPSWLYQVEQGATTVWERWDGRRPDGTFQDPGMNSFNHYAFGAVGEWMQRAIGGIDLDPDEPGYRHVVVRPRPGGGVTSARASLETLRGAVEVEWRRGGESLAGDASDRPETDSTGGASDRPETDSTADPPPPQAGTGILELRLVVPPTSRATVWLPGAAGRAVTESGISLEEAPGVGAVRQEGDDLVVEVGSGAYRFVVEG